MLVLEVNSLQISVTTHETYRGSTYLWFHLMFYWWLKRDHENFASDDDWRYIDNVSHQGIIHTVLTIYQVID
jgi:hypothetical protein